MGHVRDLPKRKLGLDVGHGYTPSYEVVPAKKDTISDLKKAAARAELVYLATDPDREGEAIAWHLQQALELPDERVRRVTFNEITERAVKDAFGHTTPINMDLVNAQQARRFLDRFVGYQLSPLLWKKIMRKPERGPRPVGGRPADRGPRTRDPRLHHRGVLEDRGDRQPGRLVGRVRPLRCRPGRVRRREVRSDERGRRLRRPRWA